MRPIRPLLAAILIVLAAGAPILAEDRPNVDLADVLGRLDRAIAQIKDPEDRGFELLTLASLQRRAGNPDAARDAWNRAVQAVAEIPGEKARYNHHLLTWIAGWLIKAHEPEAARATIDRALQVARAMPDSLNKFGMLEQIITLRREANDPDGVRAAVDETSRFVEASADSYIVSRRRIVLIQVRVAAGEVREGLTMLVESEPPADLKFDQFRYEALTWIIGAITRAGQAEDRTLLEEDVRPLAFGLADGDLRNQALSQVIRAELKLGLIEKAQETILAIDPGAVPLFQFEETLFRKAGVYAGIAQAQAEAKDRAGARASADEVVRIVEEIEQTALKGRPLTLAALALVEAGDFDRALEIAGMMVPASVRASCLVQIAEAQRATDPEAARATFDRALTEAREFARHPVSAQPPEQVTDEDRKRLTHYAAARVAQIEAQMGDLDAAERHCRALEPDFNHDPAAIAIAEAHVRAGDLSKAIAWAEALEPPRTRVHALAAIATQLVPKQPK